MKRLTQTAALVAAVLIWAASTAAAGPACTPTYPRGYHAPHITKKLQKSQLRTCTGGDIQSTWGTCVPRFAI
jgi:ABC-type enterobactin transport system permease subunit